MKYLITGGCGFVGSNLAAEVLKRGGELFIFDNLSRYGSEKNLEWLKTKGNFKFYHSDIRSYNDVENAIISVKPNVIFHLAGQVAMTTSLLNPRLDFETNVIGGHNLLECVRKYVPECIVTYSSTNKVYGDLESLTYTETDSRYRVNEFPVGFDESLPLNFQSPYGCSKGAVDQYMLDYAKMFGLKTIVFRHSSIFGGRQFATEDQGWIGWFIQKALEIKNSESKSGTISISGNGKQVRDVLFVDDLISCYFLAVENIDKTRGRAYNIGGGVENSLSLLELFDFLRKSLNIEFELNCNPPRQSDQKVFIADNSRTEDFNWAVKKRFQEGIQELIEQDVR
jgi:CDP-paratose 2-epimerase